MNIITRYILSDLLKSFFLAFAAMSVLLIIIGLVQSAIENSLPFEPTARLVPFVSVEMSRFTIPMTFLLAVTTFFARMSGNNEVIALKSLGIAPRTYLYPVMFLGVIMSLASVWLNEQAVTWGRAGAAAVIYNATEDILLNKLRTTHQFVSPNGEVTIKVRGVENRRLISPTISLKNKSTFVEAKYAVLKINFLEDKLTVVLNQPKVSSEDNVGYIGEEYIAELPLSTIVKKESGDKRASDIGLDEIPKKLAECNSVYESGQRSMAAQRTFSAGIGSVYHWNNAGYYKIMSEQKKQIERLYAERQRRWATGFSCLFFVFLGAPMAIWMKKADTFSSFFACFCPILLVYYPLLMYGMQGAKNGTLPAASVWIANICIALAALWFWRRIHRY
ncbi:MAG: LptF/LptG family permease [Planctomycetaceae bacterium]|nr:LptF/LptG family permease [Planctomycetaceae bacterium]